MNKLYISKDFFLLTISFFYLFPAVLPDRFMSMDFLWPVAKIQYLPELFLAAFMLAIFILPRPVNMLKGECHD